MIRRWLDWFSDRREPLSADGNVALERLEAELKWYDRSARRKKFAYRSLGTAALAISASIPVSAALGADTAALGLLGALVVVIQGIIQLFQLHEQWLSHRGAYERLKSEEVFYLARAGPYKDLDDADRKVTLAERVEAVRAAETGQWLQAEQEATRAGRSKSRDP